MNDVVSFQGSLYRAFSAVFGFAPPSPSFWSQVVGGVYSDDSTETAAGDNALISNTTGAGNSAFGQAALGFNTTGTKNSAFGAFALQDNIGGSQNTAVGFEALLNNSGSANTAVGTAALLNNTTATANSAFGQAALTANTMGSNNSAFGAGALSANNAGTQNTALGTSALESNTSGQNNIAIGYGALIGNVIGNFNIAIGGQALLSLGDGGDENDGNIAIGNGAGFSLQSGNNNIYIFNQAAAMNATDSGSIRIGLPGVQTAAFIAGINNQAVTGAAVIVDPNTGQLGVASSSRRYKEDIMPMADASDRLLQLRPVQFRYKKPNANGQKPMQYGLIAEEVAEVLPELVVDNKDGEPETVAYHLLPAMLLNELQKEHAMNEQHSEELKVQDRLIRDQAGQIAKLEAQASEVDALKARLADLERVTTLLAKMNSGDGVTVQKMSQRVADSGPAAVAAR